MITINERENKIKAYIDLHFTGLRQKNSQIQRIYDNPNLTWAEKLDKIEAVVSNWTADKKSVAELRDNNGDFEYSDGTVGYETEYEWLG